MSLWNAFSHWSIGTDPDVPPQEVLAEAKKFLAQAAERNEATLLTLDGQTWLGWHPEIGLFDIVRKRAEAPEHLPEFLARLAAETRVHHGGASPEAALSGLLIAFRQVSPAHSAPLGPTA
jgi:hypothetical protein